MAHRDSASQRLTEAIRLLATRERTAFALKAIGANGEETVARIISWEDMDDELLKNVAARRAMSLTDEPIDAPIKAAFAAANLDPDDPLHWNVLMFLLSWAHFGDRRRRGAPTKWDSVRLSKLISDFNELKGSKPALSTNRVLGLLGKKADYQTKKGPISPNRLAKLLKEASDPTRNELLYALEHKTKNA